MEAEWSAVLVCPFCKGKLRLHTFQEQGQTVHEYWCLYDGIAFPIIGTTPIFIDSQARTLSAEEKLQPSSSLPKN